MLANALRVAIGLSQMYFYNNMYRPGCMVFTESDLWSISYQYDKPTKNMGTPIYK